MPNPQQFKGFSLEVTNLNEFEVFFFSFIFVIFISGSFFLFPFLHFFMFLLCSFFGWYSVSHVILGGAIWFLPSLGGLSYLVVLLEWCSPPTGQKGGTKMRRNTTPPKSKEEETKQYHL